MSEVADAVPRASVQSPNVALGAIVLAGGRGSRLGGVDKASVHLGGERLVDRVVRAVRAREVAPVVVVGPELSGLEGCTLVTESPRFGGPLVALEAGVRALEAKLVAVPGTVSGTEPQPELAGVLLLACDLVHPAEVIGALLAAPDRAGEAVVLRDPEGRAQWLAGRYRCDALRAGLAAARATGPLVGRPLRHALRELAVRFVEAPAELVADIDEPDDLARATAHPE